MMKKETGTIPKHINLTCLFGAFVFLQFTVLSLANHAGEGYLTTGQREWVYYVLQVFVILGYLLHSLYFRFCTQRRIRRILAACAFGLFFVCVFTMLAAGRASSFYVAVSMAAVLCLGGIGGAAHLRMSLGIVQGMNAARCMGIGSAIAVALQYLFQLRWSIPALLAGFMLAAFIILFFLLFLRPEAAAQEKPDGTTKAAHALRCAHFTAWLFDVRWLLNRSSCRHGVCSSALLRKKDRQPEHTPPYQILSSVFITSIYILFTCFYNEYIHHLMIRSAYTHYNVYSWPRLMLIPGYLLFAFIGDRRNGKYVPVTSLCIMLITLLNVVLTGTGEAYWLNMCLFYFSIAAFTSYYLLAFWRLAPGSGHPALWAPFGRMLDSGMVLLTGVLHLSKFPAPVILGADILGIAAVIVLMTLGGDFSLAEVSAASEIMEVRPETAQTMSGSIQTMPELTQARPENSQAAVSQEEVLQRMCRQYELTEREADVLHKLLLTEDGVQAIADSMMISRRVLERHITSIYQKTGTKTRIGLFQLYHCSFLNDPS